MSVVFQPGTPELVDYLGKMPSQFVTHYVMCVELAWQLLPKQVAQKD